MPRVQRPSRTRCAVVVALLVPSVVAGIVAGGVPGARADVVTVSGSALRTGWDPAEPNLSAGTVAASDFGQLFSTQLDGAVYAQPIIAGNTLLVTTENDKVYGLDPVTGVIRWSRDVGPPWPSAAIGCGDVVPNVGSTSTPVVDAATDTAYFTAKVDDGPDQQHPHWYLHAVDIATGAERSGFPTTITGAPNNDPSHPFNAFTAMQRPGLLLMGGVVYAGFGSHCDHSPYVGYVIGVDAVSGAITTIWSAEGGSSSNGAGIWQSGGGLVSDGAGRIIFATGNGVSPAPGPGSAPPTSLAESVVRLGVNQDGSLTARDFFSPVNNTNLDRDDSDLGSGGPVAIPDGYGTAAHPHLLVEAGKDGRVFLLDRDHLGGTAQGPGGTDAALQTVGSAYGVWGHPAFWGGGTGYVYLIENSGQLRAYQLGVNGSGAPALAAVGTSASSWGYTSGSPVVTSNGTTPGSALVWGVYSSGPSGAGGELRAYDAIPSNGLLALRYAVPIGTASKFEMPATDNGRIYVGNRDGKVFAFGRPVGAAVTAQPTDFGQVDVGSTKQADVTVTATRTVTITSAATSAPFSITDPGLPVTLQNGQQLVIHASFAPDAAGVVSQTLDLQTDAGSFSFDLHGTGTAPGLGATPTSVDYGNVPVGGTVTRSVSIVNTSRATETITGTTAPSGAFSVTGLPANGSTLASGASVPVTVKFAPLAARSYSSALAVTSDSGGVTVPLTGSGVTGSAHLTLTPTTVGYGRVSVGQSRTKTFDISNTGTLVLTITKAAPPTAPFITTTPLAEGQQIEPGDVIHQAVTFRPTAAGPMSGVYQITADDGQGPMSVNVSGQGTHQPVTVAPPTAGGWTANGSASQQGADSVLTDTGTGEAGSIVSPTVVNPVGLHAAFTAQIGGGSGADGLAFDLLDAATTSSTSLGNSGGSLGFAGLTGDAVSLDTYQNPGEPSNNFTGIAVATSTTPTDQMPYVASKDLPGLLTTGTHTVDITVGTSSITVLVDGNTTLTATVPLPERARLAFSAGSGGLTDQHVVRDVTITYPPPVGPIVGRAGKCLTRAPVSGGVSYATITTCAGTRQQRWLLEGNGTLTTSGNCLSVAGNQTADGSPVVVARCDGAPHQRWVVRLDGTVRNPASRRCLDAGGDGTAPSTRTRIRNCSTTSVRQQWRVPS